MNFGRVIKKEIVEKGFKDKCCKKAFLSGLIRGAGMLYEQDGEIGLDIPLLDEETATLVSGYFLNLFGYEIREFSAYGDKLNKRDVFLISIKGEKGLFILNELGILISDGEEYSVNMKIFGDINKKECCLRAFMKGLFTASGSCTVPSLNGVEQTGYHIELSFYHAETASEINGKLANSGIIAKIMRRKDRYIVYLKAAEDISNFLAFIGASRSALTLTDIIIAKEITNTSNRRTNCDLANLEKQVSASQKQIKAINKIFALKGENYLKQDLLTVAKARIDNPEETLSELATRLNVSKSCLNHRLRKILLVAEKLGE
ncbi:MAG: DNA-binding protein WhiA [Clostridia bacterium]|nr:DNA-binding protein WhiA [Clostridia bacterium]